MGRHRTQIHLEDEQLRALERLAAEEPPDAAPAEIEADIGAAREQVRSERAGVIEGIRRGLESAARKDGRPVDETFAELRSRYGPPAET